MLLAVGSAVAGRWAGDERVAQKPGPAASGEAAKAGAPGGPILFRLARGSASSSCCGFPVIRPGCYLFGQLCVGVADGVAAAPLDGDVVEVVDVGAGGVLPCVAAMATVAVPAPSPPARTAVMAALRSSVPLANAMDVSPFPASRVRLALKEGSARELAAGRRRGQSTF
jgi:hypothetical protein